MSNDTTTTISQTDELSDAGGVAARKGFKYQDHAAVWFVIGMINGDIVEVQCETRDDIQVKHHSDSGDYYEFIQVKTTEGDNKWRISELCKVDGKGSIFTKSFGFDDGGNKTSFRLITQRDVDKKLNYLTINFDDRNEPTKRAALINSIRRESKKYKSPSGREADYWVDNTIWQVSGAMENLIAINQKKLLQSAEQNGSMIMSSDLEDIYGELLDKVETAATASNKTQKKLKVITKREIAEWWSKKLEETSNKSISRKKPYTNQSAPFFIEFHSLTENEIKRGLTGLDVGYERKKWRAKGLAEHLKEWFPEIALKASVIANINHTNLEQVLSNALNALRSELISHGDVVISDILLHIGIRQVFKSEPIACKIFYLSKGNIRGFPNAHIVRRDGVEEIWLGKAVINSIDNYKDCVQKIIKSLNENLDTDFLKSERQVILDLREKNHLMPLQIEKVLYKNEPIDKLLKHLCLPVLIAYDSPSLSQGFFDLYQQNLKEEIEKHYKSMKQQLVGELTTVKVHVFLLPFENCKSLIEEFHSLINP